MQKNATYWEGMDWLRSFFSLSIVEWHLRVVGRSSLFSKNATPPFKFFLTDFINLHILLLGVPIFIALSCFLFGRNPSRNNYWRKLKELLILLVFWTTLFQISNLSLQGFITTFPSKLGDLILFVLQGGRTNYYFFCSLIFCISLCHYSARLQTRELMRLSFFTLILLFALPFIAVKTNCYLLTAFWNPLNFLPYPFAALLYHRHLHWFKDSSKATLISGLLLTSAILFAYVEWEYVPHPLHFLGQGYQLPAYTRLSLFFSSYFLLTLVLFLKPKSNPLVHWMSRHSLALYVLHPFFIPLADRLWEKPLTLLQGQLKVLFVVVLCYLTALVLKLFLNDKLLISSTPKQSQLLNQV